jgi:hypothetical protein
MSRRYSASACLLGLALLTPLPAQETVDIKNWSAPPFWAPPKAAKPDDSASSVQPMEVEGAASPMPFIATTPCRVVDTRNANGPYGGPAIGGGAPARTFAIAGGPCPGIPVGAGAFSINVAAILPAADGFLTVFPTGVAQPLSSDLNFLGGETIANALIVPAGGASASINVFANVTAHLIIDINGYYLPNGLDSTYVNEGQASSISSSMIADGSIVNADINASAAIADTKLATIATAGKVADSALSANVSKLGQSIESAEIADSTVGDADIANTSRLVMLPLASFFDCEGSGALLDFSSGVDLRANFVVDVPANSGPTISFDSVVGSPDQGTEVCSQLIVPTDYFSGGSIRVFARKSAHAGASEVLRCALGVNAQALGTAGIRDIHTAVPLEYSCFPTIPVALFARDTLRVYLSITSNLIMDNDVQIMSVAFEYSALR